MEERSKTELEDGEIILFQEDQVRDPPIGPPHRYYLPSTKPHGDLWLTNRRILFKWHPLFKRYLSDRSIDLSRLCKVEVKISIRELFSKVLRLTYFNELGRLETKTFVVRNATEWAEKINKARFGRSDVLSDQGWKAKVL